MNENKDHEEPADKLRRMMSDPSAAPDDFEREAREGFARLRDTDEALELQRRTDSRVQREIFARDNRPRAAYWLAAAGLAGVISIAAYFIRSDAPEPKTLSLDATSRQERLAPAPAVIAAEPDQTTVGVSAPPPAPPADKKAETQEKKSRRMESEPEQVTREVPQAEVASADMAFAESKSVAAAEPPPMVTGAAAGAPVSAPAMQASRRAAKSVMTSEAATAEPVLSVQHPAGNDSLCARVLRDVRHVVTGFDAVLLIGSSGNVEKVRLTRARQFTSEQRNALEQALLKLRGFVLSADPGKARFVEYRLGCAPR